MKRPFLAVMMLVPLSASAGTVSPFLLHPPPASAIRPAAPASGVRATDESVSVTVRTRRPPDEALLSRLASVGAEPVRLASGAPAVLGTILSASVPRSRLTELAALAEVESVEPIEPLVRIRPLNQSAELVGAPAVWQSPLPHVRTRGEGVIIGDWEGAWDPFHPDFFFPDGGYYDFEDVDGDGVAGPGDRVDLDGDGVFEATLSLVGGPPGARFDPLLPANPEGYDAGIEWLYVDENGNGKRDYGAAAGFDDSVPAFGEPIFTGDDVDGDGRIQVGEKLVRLGTSKVVAISTDQGNRVRLYRRGVDLSSYVPETDPYHGSGTSGIAAGGWPGLRRWTGIAPGAELFFSSNSDPAVALAQAKELGVGVMFWEQNDFGHWDGSDHFEEAVSAAAEDGMIQVAPAGNAASVSKAMRIAPFEGTATVRLDTSGVRPAAGSFYAFFTFPGSPNEISLEVEGVDGSTAVVELTPQNPYVEARVGGMALYFWGTRSNRGTAGIFFLAGPLSGSTLPETVLTFRLTHPTGASELRGFVWDNVSGWARGVRWLDHVSDVGTAMAPSTADKVIAVSAYGGVWDMSGYPWGGPVGARRGYAGKGPRIDGARVIDISSPDDPITPYSTAGWPHGSYTVFGGTSGATPHVAGVAALVLSLSPGMSHDEMEELLTSSARRDSFTGDRLPDEDYGYGKVDAARAILGVAQEAGSPPSLRLELVGEAVAGRPVVVRAVVDDPDGDGDRAVIAWDVGYDGEYEVGFSPDREHRFTVASPGKVRVVAQAVDPTGRTGRALLEVEVAEAPAAGKDGNGHRKGDDGGGAADGGCEGGCSAPGAAPFAWMVAVLSLAVRRRR